MIKTKKKRSGFLEKTGLRFAEKAMDSSFAKKLMKKYLPEMYAEYQNDPEKYKETIKKNMKAFRAGNLAPEMLEKEAIAMTKIPAVEETKKKTKKKKNKNRDNVVLPEKSKGKSKSNKPAPIKQEVQQGVQQGVQQETVYGMSPYMLPKEKEEEEEKITDDIKPLGSPGMYGAIVLGLFSFAAYLQFSAFRDKQL